MQGPGTWNSTPEHQLSEIWWLRNHHSDWVGLSPWERSRLFSLSFLPRIDLDQQELIENQGRDACAAQGFVSKATQKWAHTPFHLFIHSSINTYVNLNNNQRGHVKNNDTYLGTAGHHNGLLCHKK